MWDMNTISWGTHAASYSLAGWRSGILLLTSAEGDFGQQFPFQKLVTKFIKPFEKCGSSAKQNRLQRWLS